MIKKNKLIAIIVIFSIIFLSCDKLLNEKPGADAGTDQIANVGSTVQLDGIGSYDFDEYGDELTYSWSIKSKPEGSLAELSNSTIVNPTFIVDKVGDYTVQLVVSDGIDDSDPATVIITAVDIAQFAGFWSGTTSQDYSLSFSVSNEGQITDFVVKMCMSIGFGSYCTGYFYQKKVTLTGINSFDVTVKYSGGSVSTIFHGTFSSDNNVNGEYDGFSGSYAITCGNQFIVGSGSLFFDGTWEASK